MLKCQRLFKCSQGEKDQIYENVESKPWLSCCGSLQHGYFNNSKEAAMSEAESSPYTWSQTDQDVTIIMPVESSMKGKDINCKIAPGSLTLGIKGRDPVLDGELSNLCKIDDSSWELETQNGQRSVKIILIKVQEYRHWNSILKSDSGAQLAEDDDENAVKAMLREWPALKDIDKESQVKMARIRPQFEELNRETPRSKLFELITEINGVMKKVDDEKKVCNHDLRLMSSLTLTRLIYKSFIYLFIIHVFIHVFIHSFIAFIHSFIH
jgi:hypothetical protein